MARAGETLSAIDGEHWRESLAGTSLHTDGGGIDVVVKGNDVVARGSMDVFTRGDIAVLTFSMSKDGRELASKLSKFNGTVVADAVSRLNALYVDGRITEAGCNAHGLRKFEAAEIEQPALVGDCRPAAAARHAARGGRWLLPQSRGCLDAIRRQPRHSDGQQRFRATFSGP
jgi:hypothetical protein